MLDKQKLSWKHVRWRANSTEILATTHMVVNTTRYVSRTTSWFDTQKHTQAHR